MAEGWNIIDDLKGAVNALNGVNLSPDATCQNRIDMALIYLRPALLEAELAELIANREGLAKVAAIEGEGRRVLAGEGNGDA